MQVDSGCTNGCCKDFSSGGGDNGVLNNGTNWSVTSYDWDELVYNTITFDGDGANSKNIFEISGAFQVNRIFGVVSGALSADVGNIKL